MHPPVSFVAPGLGVQQETPRKAKTSGTTRLRTLEQHRDDLLYDVQEAHVVQAQELFDNVLPVPHDLIDKLEERLKESNKLGAEGWRSFQKKGTEAERYAQLERIEEEIRRELKIVLPTSEAVVAFVVDGKHAPKSEKPKDNTSCPDGFSHLISSSVPDHPLDSKVPPWADLAGIWEFKVGKTTKDILDNRRKLIFGLYHILRDDPCRRFVHGFTVEDTEVRLWYCDASAIYCSDTFDLNKDPRLFIQLFAFFACATKEELGYDPSIRRLEKVAGATYHMYEIDVTDSGGNQKTYVTFKLISSYSSRNLLGRRTRVWVVCLKGADPTKFRNHHVLKNVWVPSDSWREGQTLENIRATISDEDKRYFLTVIIHGDVRSDTGPDETRDLRKNRELSRIPFFPRDDEELPSVFISQGEGALPGPLDAFHRTREGPEPYPISPRTQYRTVFEENGAPVHNLASIKDVFTAIYGAAKALGIMHTQKLVHRDVSAGNILLVSRPGLGLNGVVMDLEYAEHEDDVSVHDIKTGTYEFMPAEVNMSNFSNLADEEVEVPFRYYPAHDLCSLWWVVVWFLYANVRLGDIATKEHLDEYYRLFPRRLPAPPGMGVERVLAEFSNRLKFKKVPLAVKFGSVLRDANMQWKMHLRSYQQRLSEGALSFADEAFVAIDRNCVRWAQEAMDHAAKSDFHVESIFKDDEGEK